MHEEFLKFLGRHLPSRFDAEDVMQDVYVRVLERGGELRKEESVRAWLRRILQSALADHFRRAATRQRTEADFAREESATPPPEDDIDAVVCMCLYRLLPLLKPEYAEILRRADLEEQPRQAIADDLNLTPGSLAVRLHRARHALRRALQISCTTCPIHGYLDCGCEYTRRLRSKLAGTSKLPHAHLVRV